MNYSIRETRPTDFDAVYNLLEKGKIPISVLNEERFRKLLEKNGDCCFVAEADGIVVGNVFGMHDGAIRGYIGSLAVADDYRRRGIGKALVTKVLNVYKSLEIPRIFAHVEKTNDASIRLFKSLGIEPRETHYLIDNDTW
ncbi:MAG: GNAT family N-acetyltransferase [Candidatus Aenigmarchaeota archaeon]|nr:GNAT family N-acetyltransferase [Candidatus Aenigmarchaeota archaeon]